MYRTPFLEDTCVVSSVVIPPKRGLRRLRQGSCALALGMGQSRPEIIATPGGRGGARGKGGDEPA